MISAISSTQTTILPTARGTLAMAAYKALPEAVRDRAPALQDAVVLDPRDGCRRDRLLRRHDAHQRQHPAGLDPVARPRDRVLLRASPGYACVWYFRRELFNSARNFFYKFLFPLLGSLMLTYAFVQSAIDMYDVDYGYTVAARHRRHVRARHRRARVRRAADVPVVLLPAGRSRSSAARASTARPRCSSPRTRPSTRARSTAASEPDAARRPESVRATARDRRRAVAMPRRTRQPSRGRRATPARSAVRRRDARR